MAEKEPIIKEKLNHSGIFDFKAFYGFAHSWLKDEGFGVIEEKYSEKVSGNSRDILTVWSINKRLSDYFEIKGEIETEIKGLTDVEVEIDGERKRMNKGNISMEFKAMLIMDPEGKWDINAFYKFLRDVYNKYIIPSRVDNMREIIKNNIISLKEEIKAFLELSGRRQ